MHGSNTLLIAAAIVKFLEGEAKRLGDVDCQGGDDVCDRRDGLRVAASCIKRSFGLTTSSANTPDLYSLVSSSSDSGDKTPSPPEVPLPGRAAVSEAARQEAEQYKASGNVHLAAKRALEAATDYTKAIELDPENAVYYCNRAAALTMAGDFGAAVQDCQAAISLNGRYAKAYGRLGAAYLGAGNIEGAIEAYQRAAELDPDNVGYQSAIDQARRVRAQAELKKGELKKGELKGTTDGGSPASAGRASPSSGADPLAGAGGLDLGSLLNNPQIMQMASQMMSDPNAMRNLMNDPRMASMMQNFMGGGSPAGFGGAPRSPPNSEEKP